MIATLLSHRLPLIGRLAARTLLLAGLSLATAAGAGEFTFKISTLYPDGVVVSRLKQAGAEIEKRTAGSVKLKIYPGGVQGDDATVLRKIRTGQLHGALTQGGAMAPFYKDIQIYNVPLAFHSFEEVDYVRSRMDPLLQAELEKAGWVSFGLVEGGFAYILSNAPVISVDDLRRQKLWVPANDTASEQAAKSWGISPIVLPYGDVLTSLQTGAINAVTVPPTAALIMQWHTRVKFRTDVPLLYTYGLMTISDKYFAKLDPQQQKAVREVLGAAFADLDRQNRKDGLAAIATLRDKQGIQTVKPDAAQFAQWEQLAQKATDEVVGRGELSAAALTALRRNLADFRAGKPAAAGAAAKPAAVVR
ncbi:MAG: TRAP transporter substrate-binding protein DctP [Pseudomonadota bacterium]